MTEETEKMPGAIDEAGAVRADNPSVTASRASSLYTREPWDREAGDGQGEAAENSAVKAGEAAKESAGDPATVEAEADAEDGGNVEEVAREAAEEALPELLRQQIARLEERLAGLEAGMGRVDNPSVSSADSSLYTREPLGGRGADPYGEAGTGCDTGRRGADPYGETGTVREAGSAMHGGWQKGHLSSVVPAMGRDETISVPRAEMAMLRDCFPDKTDGEIAELYRETVG